MLTDRAALILLYNIDYQDISHMESRTYCGRCDQTDTMIKQILYQTNTVIKR